MKTTLVFAALLVSTQVLAGQFNPYNDIDPFGFDKEPLISSRSRAEVHADARAALRAGEIPRGEASTVDPVFRSTKSRTQIAAETREASRLGLLTTRGEGGRRQPTQRDEELIRLAGERALNANVASN